MDRSREHAAWLACGLSLTAMTVTAILRARSGLELPLILVPWLAAGAVYAALAALSLYFIRRTTLEEQERALAQREAADTTLFGGANAALAEPFSFARSRAQFERWGLGLVPALIAFGLGAVVYRLVARLQTLPPATIREAHPAAAVLAGQAFLLFLVSRYLLGVARDAGGRPLRAPGITLGLAALASVAGAVTSAAAGTGLAAGDRLLTWIVTGAVAVLAAETLVWSLFELYRPGRRAGDVPRAAESRLARILVEPAGWMQGAAAALDYQFGFKVSASWLYQFLRQALLPLLCVQLLALLFLSCFAFIEPGQEAVIERWGRPRAEAAGGWRLEPGAHVKWPWPVETVRRFPARRMLAMDIGYEGRRPAGDAPVLWTRAHAEREDRFLIATAAPTGTAATAAVPVSLLSFNIPIHYRISNLRQYAYGHANPDALLRSLALRNLTRESVARDLFDVMGPGQQNMAEALRRRIQADADRHQLGVTIEFVGLRGVHPPVQVADAYESVLGALEEREAKIHEARAAAEGILPLAGAEAARRVAEARAYRFRRALVAGAEAAQFESRRTGHDASPGVFRSRFQLDAVRRALQDTRLYVVATAADHEVIQFNFEDRAPSTLFDWSPQPEKAQP